MPVTDMTSGIVSPHPLNADLQLHKSAYSVPVDLPTLLPTIQKNFGISSDTSESPIAAAASNVSSCACDANPSIFHMSIIDTIPIKHKADSTHAITWISDPSNPVTQAIKDPSINHLVIQTQLPITKQVTIDNAVEVDKLSDCDPLQPEQLYGPSVFKYCYPFLRPSISSILFWTFSHPSLLPAQVSDDSGHALEPVVHMSASFSTPLSMSLLLPCKILPVISDPSNYPSCPVDVCGDASRTCTFRSGFVSPSFGRHVSDYGYPFLHSSISSTLFRLFSNVSPMISGRSDHPSLHLLLSRRSSMLSEGYLTIRFPDMFHCILILHLAYQETTIHVSRVLRKSNSRSKLMPRRPSLQVARGRGCMLLP
jgi:hypothetical protein